MFRILKKIARTSPLVVAALLICPTAAISNDSAPDTAMRGNRNNQINTICITYGHNISKSLKAGLLTLLGQVPKLAVSHDTGRCRDAEDRLVLSVGETIEASWLRSRGADQTLPEEGFAVRHGVTHGFKIIAVTGRGRPVQHVNIGVGFGLFEALSRMGFAFLHPLSPIVPTKLTVAEQPYEIVSSPHWPVRGIHLHTMHPIELTDVLNGFGPDGPEDKAGFENLLDEWQSFLMWMLANRLNRVQWVLLSSIRWSKFVMSRERQDRLRRLVEMAHDLGIDVGVDAPIVMRQQNAFRLITRQGDLQDELKQIRHRIDWLMAAGFDFLASENGTSEFTHPAPKRMLAWMNETTRHLDAAHSKRAYMKIHVSSGQTSKQFGDPVDNGPLNVNFLPYYADRRLAVMPHTVEYYGLDDPAPIYGNTGFGSIAAYMKTAARRREVVWYPETAYWCSFDIDVPLFLPLYAERRLRDLRRIAGWEKSANGTPSTRIDGQVFFSSGWEWGYWLGDVVAARASWDPGLNEGDHDAAFTALLSEIFSSFRETRHRIAEILLDTVRKERDWLINGANIPGKTFRPELTGQAYLQGEDTLDDLARLLSSVPMLTLTPTQPERAGVLYGEKSVPNRIDAIDRLLGDMDTSFKDISDDFLSLLGSAGDRHRKLLRELQAASAITGLRARQIRALFQYAVAREQGRPLFAVRRLSETARRAQREARVIVSEQELRYRVAPNRIAAWRFNPTVYRFGYLWTVRNLYYWERDYIRIVRNQQNVCFGNIIDPIEIAFGIPADTPLFEPIRRITSLLVDKKRFDRCLRISELWRR